MPVLDDPKQEAFARFVAQGKSKRDASIAAGYEGKFASAQGSKLAKRDKIKQRIDELQENAAEKAAKAAVRLADLEISARINRVTALQYRWERMKQLIEERAADPTMANIPGGKTGLLVRQIKAVGTKAVAEYVLDVGLLKEARAHEEQAAKELGQLVEKREMKLDLKNLSDEDLETLANGLTGGQSGEEQHIPE